MKKFWSDQIDFPPSEKSREFILDSDETQADYDIRLELNQDVNVTLIIKIVPEDGTE